MTKGRQRYFISHYMDQKNTPIKKTPPPSPPHPTHTQLVHISPFHLFHTSISNHNNKTLTISSNLHLSQTKTLSSKMSSIIQTIQNRSFNLPTTNSDTSEKGLLRRRLSSLSLNLHPISSPASTWSKLRRSKSVSDTTTCIRSWWQWSLNWVMSRKPVFTKDLEMNEDELSAVGSHHRGTVKHLFYKIRYEVRKLAGSGRNVGLPQTYRYDSVNYAKNFDDNRRL